MPFTGGFSSGFSTGFAIAGGSYLATGSGGVVVGGSSPVAYRRSYTATGSGGVSLAGASPIVRGWVRQGSGGVIVAGAATPVVGHVVTGTGGVALGGSSPANFYRAPTTTFLRRRSYTGPGEVGDRSLDLPEVGTIIERIGAAGVITPRAEGEVGMPRKPKSPHGGGQILIETWLRAGSGGVRISGSSPATFYQSGGHPIPSPTSYTAYGSGGVTIGGASSVATSTARRYTRTGSGGIRVAGSSPVTSQSRRSYTRTGSGGILVRGSSPATFTPAPVPPGGGGGTVIFTTPTPPLDWGAAARTKPAVTGATWNVSTSAQLNAAFAGFAAGDVIKIAANADLSGEFVFPARLGPGEWVTLRTAASDAALDAVCAPGSRMNPGKAATLTLGKLRTPGSNGAALRMAPGAQGLYIIGLDFRLGGDANSMVVAGNPYMTSAADMASRIVFDRCLGIGGTTYWTNRGIFACASYFACFDSYIGDIYGTGDSQAILVAGCKGPYYVDNNHLESGTEVFLTGGFESQTAPSDLDGVPSDLVFTHNYLCRNLAYRNAMPFGNTVKNLLELKSTRRARIAYNIMEFSWPDGQSFAVNIKSVDQDGRGLVQGTQDIEFHHNWVRHAAGGITFADNPQNPTYAINPCHRVYCHDNLWEYLNIEPQFSGGGVMVQFLGALSDITLQHETFVRTSSAGVTAFVVEGQSIGPIGVRSCVLHGDGYGLKMGGMVSGLPSWRAYVPNVAYDFWRNNAVVSPAFDVSQMPQPTTSRADDASMGYTDFAARNYLVTGALATYGHDGGPVGVSDFPALMTALAPVLNG